MIYTTLHKSSFPVKFWLFYSVSGFLCAYLVHISLLHPFSVTHPLRIGLVLMWKNVINLSVSLVSGWYFFISHLKFSKHLKGQLEPTVSDEVCLS